MTALGASIIGPEAISAMGEIATEWVEMDDLQRRASTTIARLTGGEAGFVTACCAAAITMSVAGAMTGKRLLAIERLPDDTTGLKTDVILQAGHSVSYGAPVDQSIRLAGGRVVLSGTVSSARDYHIAEAITEQTAAALYVVSHHTLQYGMVPLETFAAICHEKGVPVIVDAASECDLRGFLGKGADVVCYSGHKFLSGPTSGIVAGRKDLVRAAYLQNRGIGRAMKVGKETVAGTMAALDAWDRRDHHAVRAREAAALRLWLEAFSGLCGIVARIVPDPTNNPLDRLELRVEPESGYTAAGLAAALAAGDPPIIVCAHETERGHFQLDPCNLHPGEAEIVATALRSVLQRADRSAIARTAPAGGAQAATRWPDRAAKDVEGRPEPGTSRTHGDRKWRGCAAVVPRIRLVALLRLLALAHLCDGVVRPFEADRHRLAAGGRDRQGVPLGDVVDKVGVVDRRPDPVMTFHPPEEAHLFVDFGAAELPAVDVEFSGIRGVLADHPLLGIERDVPGPAVGAARVVDSHLDLHAISHGPGDQAAVAHVLVDHDVPSACRAVRLEVAGGRGHSRHRRDGGGQAHLAQSTHRGSLHVLVPPHRRGGAGTIAACDGSGSDPEDSARSTP